MKPVVIFFYILLQSALSWSQVLDHQKMKAGRARPDSNFVNYLIKMSAAYSEDINKHDSAEMFNLEAISIAEKIGFTNGINRARLNLAQDYTQKGKLSLALNSLLKTEASSIKDSDSVLLFNTLRVTASVYMRIGDVNMARKTLARRQYIIDNNGIRGLKDTSYQVLSQYNSMALFYNLPKVNKPDSAGYFFRKIYTLGKNTEAKGLWAQLSNGGLAGYYTSKSMYDSAIYHFNIARDASLKARRFDNYYGFTNGMAMAFQKAGQRDSAYKYAYKVYNEAAEFSYIGLLANSSKLLASLYRDEHKYDSAVKYMTIEAKFKDSLAGQETLKNIQELTSEKEFKELEQQREKELALKEYKATLRNYYFIAGLIFLLVIIFFLTRINKQRSQSKKKIEKAYHDLQATQAQLIQSEKMASLGELTAGIAHEIQNPLNFVNNFSEINQELLVEMSDEIQNRNYEAVTALAKDIADNEAKINHHGKRADEIVKGMLQHSRASGGEKVMTDINVLADEYLRLSYHGLRAKDKSFNASLKTEFDDTIGKISIVPQDIGRVLLNLFTNAFFAVNERSKLDGTDYHPTLIVTTQKTANKIVITIADNGTGIPQNIIDKIFQPFFTTKPTGQGTGLGLSLSYDIIKTHGGLIHVSSDEKNGTTFKIELPVISLP